MMTMMMMIMIRNYNTNNIWKHLEMMNVYMSILFEMFEEALNC